VLIGFVRDGDDVASSKLQLAEFLKNKKNKIIGYLT
jgi:hypothetical protein